jgi:2-methylcitrate dehydratase
MFDGDIDNDSYAPAKLRDPRILAFMRKITVNEDAALTARTGASTVPTRITAVLPTGGASFARSTTCRVLSAGR